MHAGVCYVPAVGPYVFFFFLQHRALFTLFSSFFYFIEMSDWVCAAAALHPGIMYLAAVLQVFKG